MCLPTSAEAYFWVGPVSKDNETYYLVKYERDSFDRFISSALSYSLCLFLV